MKEVKRSDLTDYKFRTRNRNKLEQSNRMGLHDGCIKFGKNETLPHIFCKVLVGRDTKIAEQEFFTEAKYLNGKISDYYNTDLNKPMEFCESEKKEDCEEKIKSYPSDISKPIIKTCKEVIEHYLGQGIYERLVAIDKGEIAQPGRADGPHLTSVKNAGSNPALPDEKKEE